MTRWTTKAAKPLIAALAANAALITPVQASADTTEAENIRKLDIMLMVTSLRCRTGAHDFQADYRDFSRANLLHLNRAGEKMRGNLRARYGQRGSKRALDKVSVQMANAYGDGHPWLDCKGLKKVTRDLAAAPSQAKLSATATRLLAPRAALAFSAEPQAALPVAATTTALAVQ